MTVYRPVRVTIDDEHEHSAVVALGDGSQDMTDPALGWAGDPIPRWNGWVAAPLFARPEVDALRAIFDRWHADGDSDSDTLAWDGDTVVVHSPAYAEEEGYRPERIAPVDVDGVPRWAIGAYSWTWAEVEPLTFDECDAAGLDGTGRDGDPRFPYTYGSLSPAERAGVDAYRQAECDRLNAANRARIAAGLPYDPRRA